MYPPVKCYCFFPDPRDRWKELQEERRVLREEIAAEQEEAEQARLQVRGSSMRMTPRRTRPVSASININSRSYLSSLAVNRNVFF